MQDGRYKAGDAATTTDDWISLNFSAIPTEAVKRLCTDRDAGTTDPEWLEPVDVSRECEACEGTGGATADEFADDCEECDGYGETERELCAWPVAWGTMWQCDDDPGLAEDLVASGFIVYRPAPETGLDGLIFGVDGGGYSFHGQHWIPLRARAAVRNLTGKYGNPERLRETLTMLEDEATRQGDGRPFREAFGRHYRD